MSDFEIDLSTALEMTIEGVLRMLSIFLIYCILIRSVRVCKIYLYKNISPPIVISTGAVAEWRNLSLVLAFPNLCHYLHTLTKSNPITLLTNNFICLPPFLFIHNLYHYLYLFHHFFLLYRLRFLSFYHLLLIYRKYLLIFPRFSNKKAHIWAKSLKLAFCGLFIA